MTLVLVKVQASGVEIAAAFQIRTKTPDGICPNLAFARYCLVSLDWIAGLLGSVIIAQKKVRKRNLFHHQLS